MRAILISSLLVCADPCRRLRRRHTSTRRRADDIKACWWGYDGDTCHIGESSGRVKIELQYYSFNGNCYRCVLGTDDMYAQVAACDGLTAGNFCSVFALGKLGTCLESTCEYSREAARASCALTKATTARQAARRLQLDVRDRDLQGYRAFLFAGLFSCCSVQATKAGTVTPTLLSNKLQFIPYLSVLYFCALTTSSALTHLMGGCTAGLKRLESTRV